MSEGGMIETYLIEKTIVMNEKQIHDLCIELKTMDQGEAEKMAVFIEERISQCIDDHIKQSSVSPKREGAESRMLRKPEDLPL